MNENNIYTYVCKNTYVLFVLVAIYNSISGARRVI